MSREDRMTAFTMGSAKAQEQIAASSDWRAAAIAMLAVRVIQGFIYWGGGRAASFTRPGSSIRINRAGWRTSSRPRCRARFSAWIA